MSKGWYGIDLDGTLAYYDEWRGAHHIGEPIPLMLERVKALLAGGADVRIFTARVGGTAAEAEAARSPIQKWCLKHIGRVLPVTCSKDYGLITCFDDRCIQVIPNTGVTIADELEAERQARRGGP